MNYHETGLMRQCRPQGPPLSQAGGHVGTILSAGGGAVKQFVPAVSWPVGFAGILQSRFLKPPSNQPIKPVLAAKTPDPAQMQVMGSAFARVSEADPAMA